MTGRLVRIITVLWALGAATLPGILSIADARDAAAAPAPVPSHVESADAEGCPPVHDGACVICSTLRLAGGAVPGAAALPARGASLRATPRAEGLILISAELRRSFQPRAPPAA